MEYSRVLETHENSKQILIRIRRLISTNVTIRFCFINYGIMEIARSGLVIHPGKSQSCRKSKSMRDTHYMVRDYVVFEWRSHRYHVCVARFVRVSDRVYRSWAEFESLGVLIECANVFKWKAVRSPTLPGMSDRIIESVYQGKWIWHSDSWEEYLADNYA